MSLSIAIFLAGLFGVPVALLILGHRLRRRPRREQRIFWGALAGHCLAAIVAVIWGMIPPETWTADETLRGAAGFWGLLVLPIGGGIVGAVTGGEDSGRHPAPETQKPFS